MQISRELMSLVSEVTGDGFCICEIVVDAEGRPCDYRFLEVNPQFERFTGLTDARGRSAREMVPDLEDHWIETYARVGLGGEKLRFENGSAAMGRWFEVYATPANPRGTFSILFRDTTARREAELARERALEQTQRLLQELNHRVKNSLSVISAVVALEAQSLGGEGRAALQRLRARIVAVGELYNALGAAGSNGTVEAGPYLSRIVAGMTPTLGAEGRIDIMSEVDPLMMTSRQAVIVGLIVNELVMNSVKHAFGTEAGGVVSIGLQADGPAARLRVRDNGRGTPAEPGTGGLGAMLVEAFVADLAGRMAVESGPGGTAVSIDFPLERADGDSSA